MSGALGLLVGAYSPEPRAPRNTYGLHGGLAAWTDAAKSIAHTEAATTAKAIAARRTRVHVPRVSAIATDPRRILAVGRMAVVLCCCPHVNISENPARQSRLPISQAVPAHSRHPVRVLERPPALL